MANVSENGKNQIIEYESGGQPIKLSMNIVKEYLVSGGGAVSDQEVAMFLNLCKYASLNPWLREAYLIKYGANSPATMVVGKDAFMKRAEHNRFYDGFEAGIVVVDENGQTVNRDGAFKLPTDTIVGGYAEVWRKDRNHSTKSMVSMDEYIGRKANGEVTQQWKNKPATMIRKVALVQALREAFPDDFGGMYIAEEMGIDEPNLEPISQEKALEEKKERNDEGDVIKERLQQRAKEKKEAEKAVKEPKPEVIDVPVAEEIKEPEKVDEKHEPEPQSDGWDGQEDELDFGAL